MHKIFAVIESNDSLRRSLVEKQFIRCGFALTPSDAHKVILSSIDESITYYEPYFVASYFADSNLSNSTFERLYNFALQGRLVLLGMKKLPRGLEFMFDILTSADF